MKHASLLAAVALAGFAAAPFADAKVALDPFFGDHMVVARDKPVVVLGTVDGPGPVKVRFGGETTTAEIKDGRWRAVFPAKRASKMPVEIRASDADGEVVVKDVLVGDLWIASGQSNMEFELRSDAEGKEAVKSADDDALRVRTFGYAGKHIYNQEMPKNHRDRMTAEKFYEGSWAVAKGPAAGASPAVGYWFGARLRREANVPVGIVSYAIGGAPLESFYPIDALRKDFPDKTVGNWQTNAALPKWTAQRGGRHLPASVEPIGDEFGPNHGYKPGFPWAAGPERLTPFPVTGFLWYQGESNAIEPERVEEYPALQAGMVAAWRAAWNDPKLPFYFVQLSSCEGGDRLHWGPFRNAQREGVALIPAPSGMAVAYDVGPGPNAKGEVHPNVKRPIGERLAALALRDVHGKRHVAVSPEPVSAVRQGDRVVVKFKEAAGLKFRGGAEGVGFELAESPEGPFVAAKAIVRGDSVALVAPGVSKPAVVRYAWASWCVPANLENGAGVPAPTFSLSVK